MKRIGDTGKLAMIDDRIKAEREQCTRDVCMYCDKRARGYGPAKGPNIAGNWVHCSNDGCSSDVLCFASGIFARARYEDWGAVEAIQEET